MKDLKKWLKAILSAAIGAFAQGIGSIAVKPDVFNLGDGFMDLMKMGGVGALIAVVGYLKTHPLPGETVNDKTQK